MRRILAFLAIGAVCALAVGIGGYLYFHTFSPDRSAYPLRGIDVSHHQGDIDWGRVAADDVSFVVMKATEGGDHVDRKFAFNLAAARQARLKVGAYHFFTFCRPGADQAANFLRIVPADDDLLPPVVDIEFGGNCPDRPSPDRFATELKAFLDPVEQAFGKPAIVYVIGDAIDMYGSVIPERRLWVRSLAYHPGHEDWIYWQYHNSGSVDGITGPVDLNVLQGGEDALEALTRPPVRS